MIGIVDYGSGNIHAIANIYKRLNLNYIISGRTSDLEKSTHLILPGVGAFDETMRTLKQKGLKSFLDDMVLNKHLPIMGICVGMQLLSEGSEEGNLEGFGWIKGFVKKFDVSLFNSKPYLPHLGWNTVSIQRENRIFDNIIEKQGFYFLHSYFFDCFYQDDILGRTNYGLSYASAVNHKNVFGMQFHPEKSHQNGINIFKNFSNI